MGETRRRREGVRRVTCPGARGSASMGARQPSVYLARGARPEVGEELVDHRRPGNERDDPHGAMAGRTRQQVDLDKLPKQGRRRAFAHRRLASVGASLGAGAIAGGASGISRRGRAGPRRFEPPWMPSWCIRCATRFCPTRWPASRKSTRMRGAPFDPSEISCAALKSTVNSRSRRARGDQGRFPG